MLRRKGLLEVLLRLTVRQVLRGRGGVVGRTQEQGRSWSQSRLHSNWRLSVFRHLSQQNSDRWRNFFFAIKFREFFFPKCGKMNHCGLSEVFLFFLVAAVLVNRQFLARRSLTFRNFFFLLRFKHYITFILMFCQIATVFREISSKSEAECSKTSTPNTISDSSYSLSICF